MLVEETPPIEIPEPTPKDLPPSRPVHKATPTPHDSNEEPTNPVAELIGKFVGSAIARVAEAGEVPRRSRTLHSGRRPYDHHDQPIQANYRNMNL